jgi:hypothetical protein
MPLTPGLPSLSQRHPRAALLLRPQADAERPGGAVLRDAALPRTGGPDLVPIQTPARACPALPAPLQRILDLLGTARTGLGSMLRSQFSAIFANLRRKNWRFLKNQCYDHNFCKN